MNKKQKLIISEESGSAIAFDQSPKANQKILEDYGIFEEEEKTIYKESLSFHKQVLKSKAFNDTNVIGVIINDSYLEEKINGYYIVDYLWEYKNIVSFVRMDRDLADEKIDDFLDKAKKHNAFGVKVRKTIYEAKTKNIEEDLRELLTKAKKIYSAGLLPIIEPVVPANSSSKLEIELILKEELLLAMDNLDSGIELILRITPPTRDEAYEELLKHPSIVRIFALAAGHSRQDAINLLVKNPGIDASFGRVAFDGLKNDMPDEEFDKVLEKNLEEIHIKNKTL